MVDRLPRNGLAKSLCRSSTNTDTVFLTAPLGEKVEQPLDNQVAVPGWCLRGLGVRGDQGHQGVMEEGLQNGHFPNGSNKDLTKGKILIRTIGPVIHTM